MLFCEVYKRLAVSPRVDLQPEEYLVAKVMNCNAVLHCAVKLMKKPDSPIQSS